MGGNALFYRSKKYYSENGIKKAVRKRLSKSVLGELTFDAIYHSFEGIRMIHREVGQCLSVQSDIFLTHLIDKIGVIQTFGSDSSIDTCYPQPSEGSLFVSPVSESIHHTFI